MPRPRPEWVAGTLDGRLCYTLDHPTDLKRCAVVLSVPAEGDKAAYYSALVAVEPDLATGNDGLLRSFDQLDDARNWATEKLLGRRTIWEKVWENARGGLDRPHLDPRS